MVPAVFGAEVLANPVVKVDDLLLVLAMQVRIVPGKLVNDLADDLGHANRYLLDTVVLRN